MGIHEQAHSERSGLFSKEVPSGDPYPASKESKFRKLLPWYDIKLEYLSGRTVEPYASCGRWLFKGCLNHERHGEANQKTLEGDFLQKDLVRVYRLSCGRLGCPTCYEKAAGKLGKKVEHRMEHFKLKGRVLFPKHVTVSPSEKDITNLSLSALRRKAYKMAMECGIIGGIIVFHHLREIKESDQNEDWEVVRKARESGLSTWYLSPHFHIVGYGFVRDTDLNYFRNGWIVKNIPARKGVRRSIAGTVMYILSHCFIAPKFKTVVWFGHLSYNKLKHVPPFPRLDEKCPLCGDALRKLEFRDSAIGAIVRTKLDREEDLWVTHGLFRYKLREYG